jgi:2-dehydro-3-deoxyphosphogluconate aldolase / (4S)-4-hydroxy-2-oxoglutarate aldolase
VDVVESLRRHVVVAVMRAPTPAAALSGVGALVKGGVRALEITYSTPDAASVISRVREEYGDTVVVGAGTVTTAEQVAESAEAGAQFLVCPGTTAAVAAAMRHTGIPFALGALTPSEVMAAVQEGADVVKLFPGSLGGPAYLAALRGPFPDVPLMPTGGVSVENARSWLDAGAICLGAGSDLVSARLLSEGDFDEVTRRAASFVSAVGLRPDR